MALDLVETLSQLVAIPSVNPMGRDVSGPEFYEYRLTEHLEKLFDRLGLPWQRQHVAPRRDNIVARLDGAIALKDGGPLIMFEAHQDTVPVDGMTIDPWTPALKDGRIYGRGACDIKGGMTAMLGAVARLAEDRPACIPTIVMACTVNEEHGYSGASQLPELWERGGDSLVPRRPDAAIIAEPTNLDVVIAHKGTVRWRCHTHGRAAHSSQPHLGENAIYRMANVIAALEQYAALLDRRSEAHPLCGRATLSVGTIRGGLSVNTVPDHAMIEIDRRLLPDEDGEAAYREIIAHVAASTGCESGIEHEPPFMQGSSLSDRENGPLADALAAAGRRVRGGCEKIGVAFGTDASRISAAGVPSVVFGPGSIDQAHTADEWLAIDELQLACEILCEFARQGL